jgi:hypothetical protein
LNHESFRCEQRRFYKVILENKRVIELAIDRSHTARPKACARVDDAQVAAIGGLESHTGHTLFAEMQFEEGLPPTCGLNCRDDFQRSSAEPLKPPEALAQWSILRINRGGEMLCNKLGIHDAANLTKAQYRVTSEKITKLRRCESCSVHKAIVSSVRTSYSICMTGLEKPARPTLLDQGPSPRAQFVHRDLEQRFETFVGRGR